MNKKAVTSSVIVIAILLVFFVIVAAIYFFPNALLPKLAETTKGFESFLPGKPKTEIPTNPQPEKLRVFQSLIDAFKKSEGKNNCYIAYESLDMGEYSIELDYISDAAQEKGVHMRFLKGLTLIDDEFVSGVQPCIALPGPPGLRDEIVGPLKLEKAVINGNNRLNYRGTNYELFGNYPLMFTPNGNLACFFTDDKIRDPNTGILYGNTVLKEGFDEDDMEKFGTRPKCP